MRRSHVHLDACPLVTSTIRESLRYFEDEGIATFSPTWSITNRNFSSQQTTMGFCSSSSSSSSSSTSNTQDDVFPAASKDEIDALRDKGVLLCVAQPKSDLIESNHHLSTVYYAEYENGTEVTLLFTENTHSGDRLVNTIRKPLFGQKCQLVTICILNDGTVEFPNTYSSNQTWNVRKRAKPHYATVAMSKFERRNDDNLLLVWVNTSNHLLSETNTNVPREEGEVYRAIFARPARSSSTAAAARETARRTTTDYVVRKASRDELDQRYKGIVNSVARRMTPFARKRPLGKRV